MGNRKQFFTGVFWLVLGLILVLCGSAEIIDDFWSSMGFAVFAVGVLRIIRHIRYRTNKEYQEKMDIEVQDERNKFISNKAWAWAGYWFVLIAAAGTIIFKLLGREDLMMLASGSVCLIILLYWVSYMILKKKY